MPFKKFSPGCKCCAGFSLAEPFAGSGGVSQLFYYTFYDDQDIGTAGDGVLRNPDNSFSSSSTLGNTLCIIGLDYDTNHWLIHARNFSNASLNGIWKYTYNGLPVSKLFDTSTTIWNLYNTTLVSTTAGVRLDEFIYSSVNDIGIFRKRTIAITTTSEYYSVDETGATSLLVTVVVPASPLVTDKFGFSSFRYPSLGNPTDLYLSSGWSLPNDPQARSGIFTFENENMTIPSGDYTTVQYPYIEAHADFKEKTHDITSFPNQFSQVLLPTIVGDTKEWVFAPEYNRTTGVIPYYTFYEWTSSTSLSSVLRIPTSATTADGLNSFLLPGSQGITFSNKPYYSIGNYFFMNFDTSTWINLLSSPRWGSNFFFLDTPLACLSPELKKDIDNAFV